MPMRQAFVAGSIAFVVLACGASPAHFWLDSGELGAAGFELGVMHPPGAPGYALLLRAATLVPLGSIGFRMAVLSSVLAAAVVFGVFAILKQRGAAAWICWGASAWLLGGTTLLRHGRVVELYAFGAALLVLAIWGLDPEAEGEGIVGRRSLGVFAAVWGTWCLGDLRLALVPAVGVAWVWAVRTGQAWARFAPLVVVAASGTALALPLASARMPAADWGDPDHARAFFDHVMARSIRKAYGEQIVPRSAALLLHNARALVERLAEDLGPLGPAGAAIALFGLWIPWPRDARARAGAAAFTWLVLVLVVYAVAINPMGTADRQTLLAFAPCAAIVVGDRMRRAFTGMPRLRFVLGPLAWVALVVPAALHAWGERANTRSWGPHAWARAALAQLPGGALLVTQSDDLSAGLAYARTVEGARPDVVAVVAQHLHKPVPEAWAGDPRVGSLLASARAVDGEADRIAWVLAHAPGPVAVEFPATGVLDRVSFWSREGRVPLRIADPRARAPTSARERAGVDLGRELATWRSRLVAPEDRRRLAVALANLARGLVRAEHDEAAAMRVLEAVVQDVDPEHASAWVALGALRDRIGQTEAAIAMTRHALALDPDRTAALDNLALYLGRDPATRPEAIAYAERSLALAPWRAAGHRRLAALYRADGEHERAAEAEAIADALEHAR